MSKGDAPSNRVYEPTDAQERGLREWVAARPPHVRAVAERFDPWSLYLMKSTGQRVMVVSFQEHSDETVTLTIAVLAEYNLVVVERTVFGVDPDDLEPCAPPSADEVTGVIVAH